MTKYNSIVFLKNLWCLAQTPQILPELHRFWVDDLGGEWCYDINIILSKHQQQVCFHFWGVQTAMWEMLHLLCKKLWENYLSKMTTLSLIFQFPHSAMYNVLHKSVLVECASFSLEDRASKTFPCLDALKTCFIFYSANFPLPVCWLIINHGLVCGPFWRDWCAPAVTILHHLIIRVTLYDIRCIQCT